MERMQLRECNEQSIIQCLHAFHGLGASMLEIKGGNWTGTRRCRKQGGRACGTVARLCKGRKRSPGARCASDNIGILITLII